VGPLGAARVVNSRCSAHSGFVLARRWSQGKKVASSPSFAFCRDSQQRTDPTFLFSGLCQGAAGTKFPIGFPENPASTTGSVHASVQEQSDLVHSGGVGVWLGRSGYGQAFVAAHANRYTHPFAR